MGRGLVLAALTVVACGRAGYGSVDEPDSGPPLQAPTVSESVLVSVDGVADIQPAIEWLVDGFVVYWIDRADPTRLMVAKIGETGDILVPARQYADSSGGALASPVLTTSGDKAAVSFIGNGEVVWFSALTKDTLSTGFPRSIATTMGPTQPGVAIAHGLYAVAYASNSGLDLGLVPESLEGPTSFVDVTGETSARYSPLIATTDGFILVWVDARTGGDALYGAYLGSDGGVVEEFVIVDDGRPLAKPRVAVLGDDYVGVAWGDGAGAEDIPTLRFTTIDLPSLVVAEPITVVADADTSPDLSLASSGQEFVLVSEDSRDNTASGTLIRGQSFLTLAIGANGAAARKPAVAWGVDRYGVVWIGDDDELYFRWLQPQASQ